MRWEHKIKFDGVKAGDIRVITKFLVFPKKLNNEWRWFEKVSYMQMCVIEMNYGSMDYGSHKEWRDIGWVGF